MTSWISARELAELAGISDRKARLALTRPTWRGCRLDVREIAGRGGSAGRSYLVAVSSLPADLQAGYLASRRPAQLALPLADTDDRQLAWMLHYVLPLVDLPSGRARKTAVMELHGREVHDWLSRPVRLNRTSLYKWVREYAAEGVAGLMRHKRSDAGKAKVFVSRKWDNAVPFDDATKAAVANALLLHIRGLWKGGAKAAEVKFFAELYLRQESEKLGFLPNDPHAFQLDRVRLNRERHYAKVWRHKMDRKASEDSRYRVRRSSANLEPMEVVVGDVHDMNLPVTLPSGKAVWPSMITFLDIATQRSRSTIIICETRGAVRAIDMIAAYLDMVTDPAWGIPRTLYLDNGKENVFAPFLKDAAKLAWQEPDGSSHRTLINARAHNPQAKAVEAHFTYFENHFLQFQQGWSGDNRHDPKVPAPGKRHAPHAAGVDAFFAEFNALEHGKNNLPKAGGELRGDSPAQRFQRFVAEGWAAVVADEAGFNMAFSDRVRVQLRRGVFRRDNREWTCDALKGHQRDFAFVYLPRFHKFNSLVVEDAEGTFLGIAQPDEVRDYLDPRGAMDSIESRKLYLDGLRQLDRTAPDIDVKELVTGFAGRQVPDAANPPRGKVIVSLFDGAALAVRPRKATEADLAKDGEAAVQARRAESAARHRRMLELNEMMKKAAGT